MIRNNFVPKQLIIFFVFLFLIISAFLIQTTFWFSLFGYFPSPCLWIPLFVYLMMNRNFPINILWFFCFYTLFLSNSVALPLQLFLSLSGTFFLINFIQKRFSTLSIFDLVLFSAGAILVFPILYALCCFFTASQLQFDFLSTIGSLIFSIPLIPGLLVICRKIDTVFNPRSGEEGLVLDL